MDSKDFRLLVALHEDARQSYRSLGRGVSLTAPAVRERLRRLSGQGVLQGYWMTPDPGVLGRGDLLVLFQGDWTHEDAARALDAPEVAWVAWKVDGGLTVQVWPRDPERAVKRLEAVLGAPASGRTLAEPAPHTSVSGLEWRIMDILVDDPRIPLAALCDRTRLSPKTVRKHLARLVRDRVVYITPKLGGLAGSGDIVFPLLVFGGVRVSEIRRVMGDALLLNATELPPAKYLLCRCRDMSEMARKVQLVQRLPGVETAIVTLNREQLVDTSFIHSLIQERIRAKETSRQG